MRLILIRHATAVERGTPGYTDDERPLTPEGERRFLKAACGLAAATSRPDAILTSPLPRARRTAEIAATVWGAETVVPTDALIAGGREELVPVLARYAEDAKLALVGHEPNLSSLLSEILGAARPEGLEFKKGAAACVDVAPSLAQGCLVWFLSPKILRVLAAD